MPVVAVALALRQTPLYTSSADVLLRYQTLPSTLSGISDPSSFVVDPNSSTDTQLQIAELPVLADRVELALRGKHISAADFGSTSVGSVGNTSLLRFTTTSGSPTAAALVASQYARQFTLYRQQLDTSSVSRAITTLQGRIDTLRADGTRRGRVEASQLASKIDQLETLLALQTSNAIVVRKAEGATKIRPTPTKYGVLGLGLGLVLGLGLAFLRDAFDSRLRSAAQIEGLLDLPVLARVPPPPRRLDKDARLVMLAEPKSAGAEAFRRLRMNLEFASIGKPSQVTMITSALPKEGKSTTIANLGVAMALAGKNVALLDFDLHRPALARLFRLPPGSPGLSSVVLGDVELDDAMAHVPLDALSRSIAAHFSNGFNGHGGNNGGDMAGSLAVLATGPLPPDPGEFVSHEAVRRIIASLRDRFDAILLDAPPLLAVGDGLTIAGTTDAVLVVVRADLARRGATGELASTLERLPATKLGFILCGEDGLDPYPYYGYAGYGYGGHRLPGPEELVR